MTHIVGSFNDRLVPPTLSNTQIPENCALPRIPIPFSSNLFANQFQYILDNMGNLKKKRRLKMNQHKRRKRMRANRHKKR